LPNSSVTRSGFRFGISKDGYPIVPVYQGGSSWSLREYTAYDLSSYNALGGLSSSPTKVSPWTWLPINNKYIVGGASNTGSTVTIQTSTSGSPASLSTVGSVSVNGTYAITNMNFMEETTGRIWISGWAIFTDAKGSQFPSTYCQYSDDGGVSWTVSGGKIGPSKNFT